MLVRCFCGLWKQKLHCSFLVLCLIGILPVPDSLLRFFDAPFFSFSKITSPSQSPNQNQPQLQVYDFSNRRASVGRRVSGATRQK
jgi:hypothetical protein